MSSFRCQRGIAVVLAALFVLTASDADAARRKRKKRKKRKQPAVTEVVEQEPTSDVPTTTAPTPTEPMVESEAPETTAATPEAGEVIDVAPAEATSEATADAEGASPPNSPPPGATQAGVSMEVEPGPESTEVIGVPELNLSVGGSVGMFIPMQGINPVAACKVRADVTALKIKVAERLAVRAGAGLGFSLGGRSDALDPSGSISFSQLAFTFDIVPAAILEIAVLDTAGVFARVGLGMMIIQFEIGLNATELGTTYSYGMSMTNAAGVLRFGVGGYYELMDHLRIVAEVVGIDLMFWEHGSGSLYTALVGVSYAL